jgi:hypothetical protein
MSEIYEMEDGLIRQGSSNSPVSDTRSGTSGNGNRPLEGAV